MNQEILAEIKRKSFHLLILLYPLIFYFLGRKISLLIFVPTTAALYMLEKYRHKNLQIKFWFEKIFGKIMRPHEFEENAMTGATYGLMAACLIFAISSEKIIIAAFLILAISDSIASIVGKSLPSKPFFEKSFAGSAAFYLSGLIIIFGVGAFYNANFWFFAFGILCLVAATIIEARPSLFKVDDNFTIPVSFAVTMTVFDWMWNYTY